MLSAKHPDVVRAARLLRDRGAREVAGCCAVDGPELLAAARAFGLEPSWVGDGFDRDAGRLLAVAGQPPSVVAVLPLPAAAPTGAPLPPRSVVLAGVRDAGNVGSILRTAVAFGVPRVALTHPDADPFARRALRASLGAAFAPGLIARPDALIADAPLAAAVPRGGVAPRELPDGAVVVLGGERDGLSDEHARACDLQVTIPAHGFESLNVAAAAAVLIAELAGRR